MRRACMRSRALSTTTATWLNDSANSTSICRDRPKRRCHCNHMTGVRAKNNRRTCWLLQASHEKARRNILLDDRCHDRCVNGHATLTVDRARRLFNFSAEGFFDVEGVASLAAQKAAALQSLGGRAGDHVSIVDVTGCRIQSQDVVAAFSDMIADCAIASRKVAFVASPGCQMRLQVRRMTRDRDASGLFDDVDSAKRWVLNPS